MAATCQIKFNHPDRVYQPGDIFSGIIEIEVTRKISINSEFSSTIQGLHLIILILYRALRFNRRGRSCKVDRN
jgi:hypothetical protein